MAKILTTTAVALFATCFAAGAAAQSSQGKPDRIVLEAKAGSVMTSASGEYQTANVGKELIIGESMMVGDKSNATVVYYYLDDAGKVERKCVERYTGANTYVIDDHCNPAAVAWVAGGNRAGAGVIIAAGVIGAAILNGMDDVPVGPLSAGPRDRRRF